MPLSSLPITLHIFGYCAHWKQNGHILGHGATVREYNALCSLFKEVHICTVLEPGMPPASASQHCNDKLKLHALPPPPRSGSKWRRLRLAFKVPYYFITYWRIAWVAEAICVRCPDILGFVGLLVCLCFPGKLKYFKYAGNWDSYQGKPLSYRIQQWMLQRLFQKWLVTMNGPLQPQKENIVSYMNPSFWESELVYARKNGPKKLSVPFRLLFVGQVCSQKGVTDLLAGVAKWKNDTNPEFQLTIVGEGPEIPAFEKHAGRLGLLSTIKWVPSQSRAELEQHYRQAHILILPSISEGWPKVLSEAMAFGTPVIATAVGGIPIYLSNAVQGVLVSVRSFEEIADAIKTILGDSGRYQKMSQDCFDLARKGTYDHYLQMLHKKLKRNWSL